MSQLFGALDTAHRAMDYHMDRHTVLSSNVANVDTPGFRPAELVRASEGSTEASLRLTGSHARHMNAPGSGPGQVVEIHEERVVRPGADGNAVSLEREMSKIAANDLRYEAVSRIVRQQIGVLRYAAGDAQR
jgi:flagellar basal-body rod protein FlgB